MNDTPPSESDIYPVSPKSYDRELDLFARKSLVETEFTPLKSNNTSPRGKQENFNPYRQGVFDHVRLDNREVAHARSKQIKLIQKADINWESKQAKIDSVPVVRESRFGKTGSDLTPLDIHE